MTPWKGNACQPFVSEQAVPLALDAVVLYEVACYLTVLLKPDSLRKKEKNKTITRREELKLNPRMRQVQSGPKNRVTRKESRAKR